ncbi:hypothetical protein B296_00028377 [Ensete ventricosum]|uniref:Uncharacterized protein n=1 Tax=Ensete ventricosum TaxID=4639 RepID=A0A426XR69_ENSVE|nr:hypothetical protein B296_00028377 [Ensete ventricosum]
MHRVFHTKSQDSYENTGASPFETRKGARVSHRGRLPTSTPPPHPGSHRVLLKSLHYFLNPSLISLPAPLSKRERFPLLSTRLLRVLPNPPRIPSPRRSFPIPRPLPPLGILSFIFGSIYCELPPEPDFGLPLQRSLCSSSKGAIFLAFFSRRLLFRSEMVFVC